MTPPPPTTAANYDCRDHILAIKDHVGIELFDLIVTNCETAGILPTGLNWVLASPDLDDDYAVYRANLVNPEEPNRHDSDKLAHALIDLFMERTGPLIV